MSLAAVVFSLAWFASSLAAADEKAEVKKSEAAKPAAAKVAAVFSFSGSLSEVGGAGDLFSGDVGGETLKDLVARIHKAKDDGAVASMVLMVGAGGVGQAQTEEIRQAMDAFKSAGKTIHAYCDSLSMEDYVLASGASKISVVPTGDVWITGMAGESPYVRGLLDKLGVKPDFLTCGEFKSASEIFMRTGPSPEAERMQNWLLDGMFETNVNLIAKGRGVSPEKVKQWINGGPYSARQAKEAGIIDSVEHRQDFVAGLKSQQGDKLKLDTKYGKKKSADIDVSSPLGLMSLWGDLLKGAKAKPAAKSAVAIVYVEGPIELGDGTVSLFGGGSGAFSTPIRKALDKVASDDSVKAVVLRVNSPGGSAVASEIILDATRRVKAKKPLVVSMGDVAGSGGYYVACASDLIYSDESTITGSIGVVGGKFATTDLWNKAGVTFKSYQRGDNAGMLSSAAVFTPEEKVKMQAWMDEVYGVFKGHVTAIRGNRLKKPIDELAGGRVYTGRQALDLGLVDKMGTLDDAVRYIADVAQLKDKQYDVRVVPEPKSFLEALLGDIDGKADEEASVNLGELLKPRPSNLLDAALPLLEGIDGKRLKSVKTALGRMELLQRERVILMMPEMTLGN